MLRRTLEASLLQAMARCSATAKGHHPTHARASVERSGVNIGTPRHLVFPPPCGGVGRSIRIRLLGRSDNLGAGVQAARRRGGEQITVLAGLGHVVIPMRLVSAPVIPPPADNQTAAKS
jgi:hypothetical protein